MNNAKILVVVPDEADVQDGVMSIRCQIESLVCHVEQAFGENARYKGRNAILDVTVQPTNAALEIRVPVEDGAAEPVTDLSSFVFDVLDRCVAGVEFAVVAAEEREVQRQKELREQAAEAARRAKVTQKL